MFNNNISRACLVVGVSLKPRVRLVVIQSTSDAALDELAMADFKRAHDFAKEMWNNAKPQKDLQGRRHFPVLLNADIAGGKVLGCKKEEKPK
ncbi:MAG: hypothetical protein ABIQ97_06765 [Lysobacteraceae bacterium]